MIKLVVMGAVLAAALSGCSALDGYEIKYQQEFPSEDLLVPVRPDPSQTELVTVDHLRSENNCMFDYCQKITKVVAQSARVVGARLH